MNKPTMSTHTLGPWTATEIGCGPRGAPGQWLIMMGNKGSFMSLPHGTEQHAANARLIAAAPDLLEACKLTDEWIRQLLQGVNPESPAESEAVHALGVRAANAVRAAIQKGGGWRNE